MRSLLLVALVLLAAAPGCKARGHDCASAAANAMKVSADGLAQIPGMKSRLGPMREAIRDRCAVDRWAPGAIACFTTASTATGLQACQDQMTPDQQTTLRRTMIEMIGMGGGGGSGGGGGAAVEPSAP